MLLFELRGKIGAVAAPLIPVLKATLFSFKRGAIVASKMRICRYCRSYSLAAPTRSRAVAQHPPRGNRKESISGNKRPAAQGASVQGMYTLSAP